MATSSAGTNGAKVKSHKSVRDLKAAESRSPRGAFSVRKLQESRSPMVEPLEDDSLAESANFHVDKINSANQRDYEGQDEAYQQNQAATGDDDIPVGSATREQFSPDEEELIDDYIAPVLKEDPLPKETVKVKFGKFVQLVGSRDFKEVVEANQSEDIVISSNLLTELAGAVDSHGEKKIPLVFLVGIAIGVILTYILFST